MTTPVSLPLFTVQEFAEAIVSHDSTMSGDDPTIQPVTALVTFTPSANEVVVPGSSPPMTVRLRPILGRLDTDGHLKGINGEPLYYQDSSTRNPVPSGASPIPASDGTPAYWITPDGTHIDNPAGTPVYGVRLMQNSTALAIPGGVLDYTVTYSGVIYDARDDLGLNSFKFHALTTDDIVDLGSVTRLPV